MVILDGLCIINSILVSGLGVAGYGGDGEGQVTKDFEEGGDLFYSLLFLLSLYVHRVSHSTYL